MEDIVKNEINVGDIVLLTCVDSNNLFRARVIKIMQKRIKCEIFNAPDGFKYMNDKIVLRLPEQVIKIGITIDINEFGV